MAGSFTILVFMLAVFMSIEGCWDFQTGKREITIPVPV
jgi:hypothetical protein